MYVLKQQQEEQYRVGYYTYLLPPAVSHCGVITYYYCTRYLHYRRRERKSGSN